MTSANDYCNVPIMIDRGSVPIVRQVISELRDSILSGKPAVGDRIPTEQGLCQLYSCSRTTIRNAVSELVNEGLLVRRRPHGTFVSRPSIVSAVNRFMGSSLTGFRLTPQGESLETRVIDIRLVVPDEEVSRTLSISPPQHVCYLERVRFWLGVPALYTQNYIPESVYPNLCEELRQIDLTKASLYDTLEQQFGLRPSFARRWVRPAVAERRIAEPLEIETCSPVFLIQNVTYDLHYRVRDFYRCYVSERYSLLATTISRDEEVGHQTKNLHRTKGAAR